MKGKFEELTISELDNNLKNFKVELRVLRFKSATTKLDNPKKIKELKKNIARIITLKNEYKLGIRESK